MRRFVAFLAAFGLLLLGLIAVSLLYFRGQVPPVAASTPRFVLRADSGLVITQVRSELETATARFARLLGPLPSNPPLTVAYIDDAKQMNAVTLYLALRQSIGTGPEHLLLPFPTPRLAAILAREPRETAGVAAGRMGLGHEVGHWLLRLYLKRVRGAGPGDRNATRALPGWLREGIAGYCEADAARIAALLRVRKALADSTHTDVLNLEKLLVEKAPDAATAEPWAHYQPTAGADQAFEFYYDETLLFISYLQAKHPGMVAKLLRNDRLDRAADQPILHDEDAFRAWITNVSPLSL